MLRVSSWRRWHPAQCWQRGLQPPARRGAAESGGSTLSALHRAPLSYAAMEQLPESPAQDQTPRRSALTAQFASASVMLGAPTIAQPDINELMSQYVAQNNNDPEAMVRGPAVQLSGSGGHGAGPGRVARMQAGGGARAARACCPRDLAVCPSVLPSDVRNRLSRRCCARVQQHRPGAPRRRGSAGFRTALRPAIARQLGSRGLVGAVARALTRCRAFPPRVGARADLLAEGSELAQGQDGRERVAAPQREGGHEHVGAGAPPAPDRVHLPLAAAGV